ncbi:hypothetical protein BH23ACT5_BH23ACT5_12000 [soil metagenome]
MTSPWDHPGFDLAPVATAIGPFASPEFLGVVDEHEDGEPLMAATPTAFIALRWIGSEIRCSGDGELTDYHTPRGEEVGKVLAAVAEDHHPSRFMLDSLPEEAAKPLAAGLEQAGWAVESRVEEVAAVLDLPAIFDDYLGSIGKKERHEVRRKRRRYEGALGDLRHETHRGAGWALDEFIRLHRLAGGAKGEFMTEDHKSLFTSLAGLDGWRFDLLRTDAGASAIVFGWSDDTGYYLYNSAYDPSLSPTSPGVVLLGKMIECAIEEGIEVFDFLKGDETYKFRLGARRRPLVTITATPRSSP